MLAACHLILRRPLFLTNRRQGLLSSRRLLVLKVLPLICNPAAMGNADDAPEEAALSAFRLRGLRGS